MESEIEGKSACIHIYVFQIPFSLEYVVQLCSWACLEAVLDKDWLRFRLLVGIFSQKKGKMNLKVEEAPSSENMLSFHGKFEEVCGKSFVLTPRSDFRLRPGVLFNSGAKCGNITYTVIYLTDGTLCASGLVRQRIAHRCPKPIET